MEALRDALARPEAAWGIRWTTSDSTIGNAVPEVATQMFFLRSLVRFESELVPLHLAHGDSDSAAECVRSMTRICSHLLDSRSSVVTLLLADAVAVEIERGIWEGVIRGVWSESQLAEFEKRLGELDPQASAARSFRGEVAFARWKSEAVLQQVDEARLKRELHLTSGWEWNGNRISKRGRAIWRTVRPQGINLILWVKGERLMVEHLSKAEREAGARFGYDELRYFQRRDADSPRALFVDPAGGDDEQVDLDDVVWRRLESITAMVLRMETRMAIVRAGIALERHRLANGEAAKSLAALVPQYLSSVPADPIDGEPLRYRQQADGSPVLWSIGVDGVDEGGLPHIDRGARGDIVWITRPIPGFTIKEYWR